MTETEIRAEMGRAGGIARAKGMSKRERKASATNAAKARWTMARVKLARKPITELQHARAIAKKVKGNAHDRRKAERAAR